MVFASAKKIFTANLQEIKANVLKPQVSIYVATYLAIL